MSKFYLIFILLQIFTIFSVQGGNFSSLIPQISQALAAALIGNYTQTLNFVQSIIPPTEPLPPDAFATTPAILARDGYPSEVHNITTSDWYVLTYHRIPYGRLNTTGGGPCVLVMHGLMSESTHWLYSPEDNNLPYLLANAGYDVWLGNARGNRYSLGNLNYTSNQPQFWNFGWNEMGTYDLPAAIDYITGVCGQPKIYYIGHSMGTTMFYVMGSQVPAYNSKIRLSVSYAPVAFDSNTKTSVKALSSILGSTLLAPILNLIPGPFTPDMFLQLIQGFAVIPCNQGTTLSSQACFAAFCATIGCDQAQFNQTLLPVYVSTFPSMTASIPIFHYMQEINCSPGCFQSYIKFPLTTPVTYNLGAITAPVALYSGASDKLADPTDVQILAGKLGNVVLNQTVDYTNWGHFDFILGIDAAKYVYLPTLNFMKNY